MQVVGLGSETKTTEVPGSCPGTTGKPQLTRGELFQSLCWAEHLSRGPQPTYIFSPFLFRKISSSALFRAVTRTIQPRAIIYFRNDE